MLHLLIYMQIQLNEVISFLKKYQWEPKDEKYFQEQLFELGLNKMGFSREYRLDNKNIPDFFNRETGLLIECKTKSNPFAVYRQLKRYSTFPEVKEILLITSTTMGLPDFIEGKPSHLFIINNNLL